MSAPAPAHPEAAHHPEADQWPQLAVGQLVDLRPIRAFWNDEAGAWVEAGKAGQAPGQCRVLPQSGQPGGAPQGALALVTRQGCELRTWPLRIWPLGTFLPEDALHLRPVLWITQRPDAPAPVDPQWLGWVIAPYVEQQAEALAAKIGRGHGEPAAQLSQTVRLVGELGLRVPPLGIQQAQMQRLGGALRAAAELEARYRAQARGLHALMGALAQGLRQGRWTEAEPGAGLAPEDASVLGGMIEAL